MRLLHRTPAECIQMDRTHQPLKVYASTGLARVPHCNGCSSQTTIVVTRGARTGTNDLASKIIKKIPVKSTLAFVRCGGNFDSFSSFKPRPMEPSARVPDNPAVGGRNPESEVGRHGILEGFAFLSMAPYNGKSFTL